MESNESYGLSFFYAMVYFFMGGANMNQANKRLTILVQGTFFVIRIHGSLPFDVRNK